MVGVLTHVIIITGSALIIRLLVQARRARWINVFHTCFVILIIQKSKHMIWLHLLVCDAACELLIWVWVCNK